MNIETRCARLEQQEVKSSKTRGVEDENKIDKKGRVSVPASFRSHLNALGYNGFITYPSFNHVALEACSQERIEKLSNSSLLNKL